MINPKYIKTIRTYIVEIGSDYTNLYKPTFIHKLNKDIIPSLLSLNKKLKEFKLEKELRFNTCVINCLNSIDASSDIELTINNIMDSIVELEEGKQC